MLLAMIAVTLQPAHAATNPTVTNLAASGVLDNSAKANCSVNPGDNEVNVWVVYKKSTHTWSTGPVYKSESVGFSGTTSQTATIDLPVIDPTDGEVGDLLPSTSYDYRCKVNIASDPDTTFVVDNNTVSFTTAADSLTVVNDLDSSNPLGINDENPPAEETTLPVRTDAYFVSCLVNPKAQTKVWVVWKEAAHTWSTGPVYGGRVSDESTTVPSSSVRTQLVSFVLEGLGAGMTYDYRCKADTSGQSTLVDTNTKQFTVPSSGTGMVAARTGIQAATSTSTTSLSTIWTSRSCVVDPAGFAPNQWFYSRVAWTREWVDSTGRRRAGIAQAGWYGSPNLNYDPIYAPNGRYIDVNLLAYNYTGTLHWKLGNDNMHGGAPGDTWYLKKYETDWYYAPADPYAYGPTPVKLNVRIGWANDNTASCDAWNYQPSNYSTTG